jgi:hypothetical protein
MATQAAKQAGKQLDPADDGASTERIRAYGREARDEGRAFLEAARGVVNEADQLARARLETMPFTTLVVAFGFGVFLGGGLPFGAVRFAGRAAGGVLLRQLVAGAVAETVAPRHRGQS